MDIDNRTEPIDANTEADALFNSAFGAALLNRACAAYEARASEMMPLTYAYLVLPSSLHLPTRQALPTTTAAAMATWIRENPLVLSDLAVRVRAFRDITSAAIGFGMRHAMIGGSEGSLHALPLPRRPRALRPTQDWQSCMDAAQFFGRWLGATENDEPTTLAQWGLRP